MKPISRAAILLAFVAAAAVPPLVSISCGTTACTPDDHDLGDAPRLAFRPLEGREVREEPCARPRLEVLASAAELEALYQELGVTPDGGVPAAGVDFDRERVIVREGAGAQGISWIVERGDTAIAGLLTCAGPKVTSCRVEVVAVPALVTRAEVRTCDPIGCGHPVNPPVQTH